MPYIDSAGAALWWEQSGAGSPLVLINGLGSPSATWHRLLPLLEARHTVLRLDNRGVGRTGVVRGGPYAIPVLAADVVTVLDAAGVGAAHVLGLSLGGLIAQEVALNFPHRVRSLILAATHPGIPAVTDLAEADPETSAALAAVAAKPHDERMRALVPYLHASTTPAHVIEEDLAVRAAQPTDEVGFSNQLLGAATWTRVDELATMTARTLVLHGRDDRLIPLAAGERLAGLIPGAGLVVVDDAGHEIFTDQTQIAGDAVLRFTASADEAAMSTTR